MARTLVTGHDDNVGCDVNPRRCKFCGSNDWQSLGFVSHLEAYTWYCRYCEKMTLVTKKEMNAK